MSRRGRLAAALVLVPVACAPLAFVLTVACAPLWERFESATGIQAYGHHGPLEWCYLATFAALVALGCVLAWRAARRHAA